MLLGWTIKLFQRSLECVERYCINIDWIRVNEASAIMFNDKDLYIKAVARRFYVKLDCFQDCFLCANRHVYLYFILLDCCMNCWKYHTSYYVHNSCSSKIKVLPTWPLTLFCGFIWSRYRVLSFPSCTRLLSIRIEVWIYRELQYLHTRRIYARSALHCESNAREFDKFLSSVFSEIQSVERRNFILSFQFTFSRTDHLLPRYTARILTR